MTPKTPQHSPTPWRVKDFTEIIDKGYSPVAKTKDGETGLANAAFIVQVVNSFDAREAEIAKLRDTHEALVEALSSIVNRLTGQCTLRDGSHIDLDLAKAALKLADEWKRS